MEFKHPFVLLLLIPYGVMVFWYVYGRLCRRGAAVAVSSRSILKERRTFRTITYPYMPALRFLAILSLIIALARPGRGLDYSSVKNQGIDIMIALDLSPSMLGEDFQPRNRLAVAKQVVRDFITRRTADRIGMVVFSGEACLQCPLTMEHDIIADILDDVDFSSVGVDGTAIGDALALAASRMMEGAARSRIILLITDGVNNRGDIDPETAAKTCGELGIKIYSVGIGKDGRVPYPGGVFGRQYVMNQFNPETLRNASSITGGRFYRAESGGVLWENIRDIDMLEKSEIDVKRYHEFHDSFQVFLMIATALFLAEILARSLLYRKIP
jgi:Ca-activated chloride channel family protein